MAYLSPLTGKELNMKSGIEIAILALCLAIGVAAPMIIRHTLYSAIWQQADDSGRSLREYSERCRKQLDQKGRDKWNAADKVLDSAVRKNLNTTDGK